MSHFLAPKNQTAALIFDKKTGKALGLAARATPQKYRYYPLDEVTAEHIVFSTSRRTSIAKADSYQEKANLAETFG